MTDSSAEAKETEYCIKGYDFTVSFLKSNSNIYDTSLSYLERFSKSPNHLCLLIECFNIQLVYYTGLPGWHNVHKYLNVLEEQYLWEICDEKNATRDNAQEW